MPRTDLTGIRILAMVPRLWPTWGAGSQRTTAFVEGFVRAGAQVTARVVTAVAVDVAQRPSNLGDVVLETIRDPLGWVPWQAMHVWMTLGFGDRQSLAHRIAARRPSGSIDAVFASGPPWSSVQSAARVAARLRAPLVVDMRDEWSANPFQTKLGPAFGFMDRRREIQSLKRIAGLSAPFPEVISTLRAGAPSNSRVIEHGCDLDLIRRSVGPPRTRNGDAPLRLVFAGARYGMINETRLLDALRQAGVIRPLELRLIGATRPVRAQVPRGVNVIVRGPLAHDQLMQEYDSAHALLTLGPRERGLGWIPSKVPEYLATGRPILGFGVPGSRLERQLGAAPGTHFVDERDPRQLQLALERLAEDTAAPEDWALRRTTRAWSDVGDEAADFVRSSLDHRRRSTGG